MDIVRLNLEKEVNTQQNSDNIKDSFHAKGIVNIKVFDKEGNLVEEVTNGNLIVKTGRIDLIKKLIGASTAGSITKCAVGSGGAPSTDLFNPYTPSDSDTTLGALKLMKTIGTTTPNYSATNPKVTFTTTFASSEVNSKVNEAGLFFNDGTTMFARYCFKTISLESGSGFSMEISWTIEF